MELECQICGTKLFSKSYTKEDKVTCTDCWEAFL